MQPLSDDLQWARKSKREHFSLELPRRIHLFWDKGFEHAPDIVQFCAESWQRHNPTWEVILLDQDAANAILPRGTLPRPMSVTHYSDMLRIAILQQHGGVWIDASVLCLRPLDHWLPQIFNQCEFFAFHKPNASRIISSWFLAANTDSVIAEEMRAISAAYWNWGPFRNGEPPYFWLHYLFEHLVRHQKDVQSRWQQVPKLSAIPVHQLNRIISGGVDNNAQQRDQIRTSPVQKLTHKKQIMTKDVIHFLDGIEMSC
jgi:hypothetical protein